MANRGPSYGMSREIQNKVAAKYDDYLEEDLREWIAATLDVKPDDALSFQAWLRDGRVLCSLVTTLCPGSLRKGMPHQTMLNPFRCMENIGAFLEALKSLGVPEPSLCTTADLYNGSGMSQVQVCLLGLVDVAVSKGWTDTDIGLRIPDKQRRNWTNEQLKAGNSIIGLQAGTNKCASQSGMTAYGSARPAFDRKFSQKKL